MRGVGLSGGFLKIALHDFIKEFGGGRGEGIVNFLSHLRSFSSGKFFLFLVCNYNIYDYISILIYVRMG